MAVERWMLRWTKGLRETTNPLARSVAEAAWTTPGARDAAGPSRPSASSSECRPLLEWSALRYPEAEGPRGRCPAADRYTLARSVASRRARATRLREPTSPRTARHDGRLPEMRAEDLRLI